MARFLSPEGNFYSVLALAADIVVVNILLLVTSVPIMTAGAALRSANFVVGQLVREEGSKPTRTFFREFKNQWQPASLWWLILVGLSVFGAYDLFVLTRAQLDPTFDLFFRAALLAGFIVLGGISVWFYALAAGWGNTDLRENASVSGRLTATEVASRRVAGAPSFKELFVAACLYAIRHLPLTLIAIIILMLPGVVLIVYPKVWGMMLFFYLVFGVAFSIYMIHLIFRKSLERGLQVKA